MLSTVDGNAFMCWNARAKTSSHQIHFKFDVTVVHKSYIKSAIGVSQKGRSDYKQLLQEKNVALAK